jgi:hypothetical protein
VSNQLRAHAVLSLCARSSTRIPSRSSHRHAHQQNARVCRSRSTLHIPYGNVFTSHLVASCSRVARPRDPGGAGVDSPHCSAAQQRSWQGGARVRREKPAGCRGLQPMRSHRDHLVYRAHCTPAVAAARPPSTLSVWATVAGSTAAGTSASGTPSRGAPPAIP